MNLLIDIGNSRIKWCLHDSTEENFTSSGAMTHDKQDILKLFYEHWGDLACPERVVVSNVSGLTAARNLDAWVEEVWQVETEYAKTEVFSHGVHNAYDDHCQLGVDRWMAIIAAWHRYRTYKESVCVVDCGTATTIDGISESGQHLGGFIFPGYTMMQEILVNDTSDINTIRQTIPSSNFSNTTEQAVNSGCYLTMLATIDHVVASMKNDYGEQVRCIITGGHAELVLKKLTAEFEYEPNLVLYGLAVFSGQAQ